MPDLDERFRSLARTPVPELWDEVEVRPPRPLPPSPRGQRVLAAVTALVVAVAGFAVAERAFREGDPVARESFMSIEARIVFSAESGAEQFDLFSMKPDGSDVRRLTDTPSSEDQPTSSPDGSRLAFAASEPGEPTAYVIGVMDADGSDRAEIPGTRLEGGNPVGAPAWSPDATQLVFTAYGEGGGIYVAEVDGGHPRRLTEAGPPTTQFDSDPEWSPSGDAIAFIRWVMGSTTEQPDYEILQVPAAGGEATLIARSAVPTAEDPAAGGFDGLSWSPDGSRLAFARGGSIYTVDAEGGEPVEVVSCEELGCLDTADVFTDDAAWSPDGRQIAFTVWIDEPSVRTEPPFIYVAAASAGDAPVVSTGVRGLFPAWQPVQSADPTPTPTEANGGPVPEGTLLLQVEDRLDRLDEGAETSTVIGEDLFGLDASPDGAQVLATSPFEREGTDTPLMSIHLDGGDRTVVAEFDGWSLPARWSPDGSRLAYRIGDENLLCIRDLGLPEPRCLPELGRVYEFDWSPDGSRLVLDRASLGELPVVDVETGSVNVIARWDDPAVLDAVRHAGIGEPVAIQFQGPRWSPSGRFLSALAMVRTEPGHSNLPIVFDLSGHVVVVGRPGGEFSDARGWSPMTDLFAYGRGEPPYRIDEVRLLDPATGEDGVVMSTTEVPPQTVRGPGLEPQRAMAGRHARAAIRTPDRRHERKRARDDLLASSARRPRRLGAVTPAALRGNQVTKARSCTWLCLRPVARGRGRPGSIGRGRLV